MRSPTSEERQLVGVATAIGGCEVGFYEVTATQLAKGIVDANASIRQAFLATGFHDFSAQDQGEKVLLEAGFLTSTGLVEIKVSLYRPNTKDGDPRLWVYDLKRLSPETIPGDLVAIVQDGSSCAVFNATALIRSGGSLGPLVAVFSARAQGPLTSQTACPPDAGALCHPPQRFPSTSSGLACCVETVDWRA